MMVCKKCNGTKVEIDEQGIIKPCTVCGPVPDDGRHFNSPSGEFQIDALLNANHQFVKTLVDRIRVLEEIVTGFDQRIQAFEGRVQAVEFIVTHDKEKGHRKVKTKKAPIPCGNGSGSRDDGKGHRPSDHVQREKNL